MLNQSTFLKEFQNTLQQKLYQVLLLGETCRDEYHYGECKRISPEAPVPIFEYKKEELKYGMAHNVFNNLKTFKCDVDFITNNSDLLIKRRFVDLKTHNQLLREDIEKNIIQCNTQHNKDYDFVVISDYDKGFLKPEYLEYICQKYKNKIFVDTKKKDLSCFSNCIIKCNDYEYSKIQKLGKNCELIVTKGKNGAEWNNKIFPAPKIEIFDVTGAGDVFLSAFATLFTFSKNMNYAIQNAVNLASRSTEHFGIYTLTEGDIIEICN
jgi:bifunctional ADP-heptose synthase (sugar kinase/adenylyltransferase)